MTHNVPYVDLKRRLSPLRAQLLDAVGGVLDHCVFVLGEETEAFETEFASYCGARFGLGVGNGTDALVLALQALGIGPGDEVITTANSFVASTSCIALVGATPVFADVGVDYNLDPQRLEEAVTPRTRAVIAVHLTGRPADMTAIRQVANRHGLFVVEDAAQAAGAMHRGQRVGALGDLACFSFHPVKTLGGCGDGGMVLTNDGNLRDWIFKARNHGLRDRNTSEFFSGNSRLATVQAAMLRVIFRHLDDWNERRRAVAATYRAALPDFLSIPSDHPEDFAVYHTFVAMCERRDALIQHLAAAGVEARIHYPMPVHRMPAGRAARLPAGGLPMTDFQAERIISLPIYPELTERQIAMVVDAVRSFGG